MTNKLSRLSITVKRLGRNTLGRFILIASHLHRASFGSADERRTFCGGMTMEGSASVISGGNITHRRYLSGKQLRREEYLQAASNYVANKQSDEVSWLHCKPYESSPGNTTFYTEMYQCLNLIRAMNVPHRGRVLEIGSGPGWITEILIALGFEVHGLDPSADMIAIASERVNAAIKHWRIQNPPQFAFYCQTLEDCTLPDNEYDGILFHASLHHVIDEESGLNQCFRLLRPGGVLGVCEGAWDAGNTALEAALDEEMERFGTLENPYTREYLDYLLTKHGFINIRRYHSINGFVPEHMGSATVESLAEMPACSSNNLTALKPGLRYPTTRHHAAHTSGLIAVLKVEWITDSEALAIRLKLTNTGETTWLHKAYPTGQVTVAVRTNPFGAADYKELERHNLPNDINPGESITLDLEFLVPAGGDQLTWNVDLVNEGIFWFSTRGTKTASFILPKKPG